MHDNNRDIRKLFAELESDMAEKARLRQTLADLRERMQSIDQSIARAEQKVQRHTRDAEAAKMSVEVSNFCSSVINAVENGALDFLKTCPLADVQKNCGLYTWNDIVSTDSESIHSLLNVLQQIGFERNPYFQQMFPADPSNPPDANEPHPYNPNVHHLWWKQHFTDPLSTVPFTCCQTKSNAAMTLACYIGVAIPSALPTAA